MYVEAVAKEESVKGCVVGPNNEINADEAGVAMAVGYSDRGIGFQMFVLSRTRGEFDSMVVYMTPNEARKHCREVSKAIEESKPSLLPCAHCRGNGRLDAASGLVLCTCGASAPEAVWNKRA